MTEIIIYPADSVVSRAFSPVTEGDIKWSTSRTGTPGKLTFKALFDPAFPFTEGDAVGLRVNGTDAFYGYIFSKKQDKDKLIAVTAYDQLRYFKNKDTYCYEDRTASEFLLMLCRDFRMQTGVIEDTGYRIPYRVEDNTTLFDMMQTALTLTMLHTGEIYTLYDEYGRISLRNMTNMQSGILIDAETGENFDYTSSIDSNTYNQIKLVSKDEQKGIQQVYTSKSEDNIARWGVLQYYGTLKEGDSGPSEAERFLNQYNKKTRTLSVRNVFGDLKVRSGSFVLVSLSLNDLEHQKLMLVEKCDHCFSAEEHFMNLTLRGGEFSV